MEEERSSTELHTVLRGKAERWRLAGANCHPLPAEEAHLCQQGTAGKAR